MYGISAGSEPAANAHALIEAERVALFLDFDGTLVEIASRPDRVGVTPATLPLLQRVRERLDGALAVVSGRSIEDIDGYLDPLVLPAAGIHGLVRRDAEGLLHTGEIDDQAMVGVMAEVTPIAVAYPQILIETKPSAVALHYRAHPKLEGVCKAAAQRIAAGRPNLQVLHGKMVVEIKPKAARKP